MKPHFNTISEQQVKQAGVRAEPRYERELIRRSLKMTLQRLIASGMWVRPSFGKKLLLVRFAQVGEPFRMRGDETCPHGAGNGCVCGYWAVRVKSQYGARTMLYFEPETGAVSGLLNIKPAAPRRVEHAYKAVVLPEAGA